MGGGRLGGTGYMTHPIYISHPELFLPRAGTDPSYTGLPTGRFAVGLARGVGRSDETIPHDSLAPCSPAVAALPDMCSEGIYNWEVW